MKVKFSVIFSVILLLSIAFLSKQTIAQQYNVTFNVNMADANPFNPLTDDVYLAGSFPDAFWNEPGTNPNLKMLPVVPGSMIYTLTLSLNSGSYEYKYFRVINNTPSWNNGEWPGGPNRSVQVVNNILVNDIWGVYSTDPAIFWANLQWPPQGEIFLGNVFNVYAQVYIPGETGQTNPAPGVQAWIGYHTSDTDPATWANWVTASYNSAVGNNDEYMADIGSVIGSQGVYYYASRFKLNDDDYVFGGYSEAGGGFWNGTDYVSGILTITEDIPDPEITWANLQWPPDGTIAPDNPFDVYAQVYLPGYSGQGLPVDGVQAWIGFHTENTNPQSWTNWISAPFIQSSGNNDEYKADIGSIVPGIGTYYYASRFQLDNGTYFYGGYNDDGGGFWDGTINVSGILTVETEPDPEIVWANLAWPPSGYIGIGMNYNVYAQVYIPGLTGQSIPADGVQAWIGIHVQDTDPSGWTNWIPATYNLAVGNNDEYLADIGITISSAGTYYYASRFQFQDDDYVYGGFSDEGGGFWDGNNHVSGVLYVEDIPVYILEVAVSPAESGEVSGAGLYPEGHEVTLTATPSPGFLFLIWTQNGTVVSTSNPYIFQMPGENLNLTAHFEPIPPPQVTFNLDMTNADPFNPTNDDVYISGTLNNWAIPGSDPAYRLLPDSPGSLDYTLTLDLDPGSYEYLYYRVINGIPGFDNPEWPEEIYRTVQIDNDTILNDEWGVYLNVTVNEIGHEPFIIFPNPAKGGFFIKNQMQGSFIEKINIWSVDGSIIKTVYPGSEISHFINLESEHKGVYIVEVFTGNTRFVKRILLM